MLSILQCHFENPVQLETQVAGRAPAMAANCFTPLPNVSHAILAKIVDDVPVLLFQQVPHETIRISIHVEGRTSVAKARVIRRGRLLAVGNLAVGTPIVFQEIKTPIRELLRILSLVTKRAREAATS